jgi:hypothetical protein
VAESNPGADRDDGRDPVDEAAAWTAIVAAYGEEPPDPDLSADEEEQSFESEAGDKARVGNERGHADASEGPEAGVDDGDPGKPDTARPPAGSGTGPADRPLGSSITAFSVGIGPRDWSVPQTSDDAFDETDDHFVPPEPPPLPEADTTAKFAWLAVIGGPLLLLLTVLLRWDMTWWISTLGIGGFLGGFATLVLRMRDDEEDDDPGHGAVV